MPPPTDISLIFFLLVLGLSCGVLAVFFGIGGGVISVPALLWYFQQTLPGVEHIYMAFTTGLAITVTCSTFAAYFGYIEGRFDQLHFNTLLPSAFVAAFIGGLVGLVTKPLFLKVGMAALLLYLGYRILKPSTGPKKSVSTPVAGFGAGLSFSLAGGGGASVMMAYMVGRGLDIKKASATTSALVAIISAEVLGLGAVEQALIGNPHQNTVNWPVVGTLVPGVVLGCWLGIRLSRRIDAKVLRNYLGWLFVLLGSYLFALIAGAPLN